VEHVAEQSCPPWCTTGPHTDPNTEDRLHLGFFGDYDLAGHDDEMHLIVDQPVDDLETPPTITFYADPSDGPEVKMTPREAREIGTAYILAADAAQGKPLLPLSDMES